MGKHFPSPTLVQPHKANAHDLYAHDLTVIILHGRGDDAFNFTYGFFSTLPTAARTHPQPLEYLRDHFPTIKWVFPSARVRYSTVFKTELSEWFDIASLTDTEKANETQKEGLVESVEYVRDLVKSEAEQLREKHGDAKGRVILGGISMGCATSVHVLLSLLASGDESVGGYFGWCGWLPFRRMLTERVSADEASVGTAPGMVAKLTDFYSTDLGLPDVEGTSGGKDEQLSEVPVFLSHCTCDGTVAVELGREMKSALDQVGMKVSWAEYDSPTHWIKTPEAMDEFARFLDGKVSELSRNENQIQYFQVRQYGISKTLDL